MTRRRRRSIDEPAAFVVRFNRAAVIGTNAKHDRDAAYFFAAQGFAAAHGFAAFFAAGAQGFTAFLAFGAHGLAAFRALGAQGFEACAKAGSGVAAIIPRAAIEPRVCRDFLSIDILVSPLEWNIDGPSQPRRYGHQPVRHGARQGGFNDFVEAG